MTDEWEQYEADKARARSEVEELGERRVRHMLATNQMPGSHLEAAEEWIASLDAAVESAKETERLEIARSAKDAAWAAADAAKRAARAAETANKRAAIALIIAAISIVVTIIGILVSYHS